MKGKMTEYYRKSEDLNRYMMANKKRVSDIKQMYKENRKYFGKKVLDIGCGGGILGFLLEPSGFEYTGVDINPDMIKSAGKHAKSVGSRNRFILCDINKKVPDGKFDTIILIGNALGHISPVDFSRFIGKISRKSRKGTHFIADYRDVVSLLFHRKWKNRMTEKRLANKRIISLTKGADFQRGDIHKISFEPGGRSRCSFTHAIWSPFIMNSIMELSGWVLVKRRKCRKWNGWLDVYKRI